MSNAAVINATSTSGQTVGAPISIETGGDVVLKAYGTGSGNWFVVMAFAPVVNGVTGAPVTLTIDYNQPGRQTSAVGTSATKWVGWVLDQGGTWQASGIVEGYQPGEALSDDLGTFASVNALPQYGVKIGARASVNSVQYTYSAGVGWAADTYIDNAWLCAVEDGFQSTAIQVIGDSTGDSTLPGNDRWPKQLAGRLATRFPNRNVIVRNWDLTNNRMSQPICVSGSLTNRGVWVKRTGTGEGIRYPHTRLSNSEVIDFSILCSVDSLASMVKIAANWDSTSNKRGWMFRVGAGNQPNILFSPDGTSIISADGYAAGGFIETGVPKWLRFVITPSNAASKYEVVWYTSPANDGVTWTQYGGSVVGASSSAVHVGPGYIELYSGEGITDNSGYIYGVRNVDQSTGASSTPELPEYWRRADGIYMWGLSGISETLAVVGNPNVTIVNGSQSGASYTTFSGDASLFSKVTPDHGQKMCIVNLGHNGGYIWGNKNQSGGVSIKSQLDGVVAYLAAKFDLSDIAILTQNPSYLNNIYSAWTESATRSFKKSYCRFAGIILLDTYQAFIDSGNPEALLVDKIHPTNAGSLLEAIYIEDRITK